MKTLQDFLVHTNPNGDCLEWARCFNTDGYPRCAWKGSSNGKVHRIVYALANPDVHIDGKVVRHTCDNPKCINPQHLVAGTPADNTLDRDTRLRSGTTKLTPDKVRAIRQLYSSGNYTQKQLGAMFACDYRTVGQVVNNQTHRWVL